jgi:uncharacterized protein (DUF1330 family)
MPKGYLVFEIVVEDEETWQNKYAPMARPLLAAAGGKFIIRSGKRRNLEGEWDENALCMVMEFPDYATAEKFYDSAEYQEVAKMRFAIATSRGLLIEGCE